jgi:hypothetical protein
MISNEIREKLQDIVRGACLQGTTDRCSAIRNFLIEGFGAISVPLLFHNPQNRVQKQENL